MVSCVLDRALKRELRLANVSSDKVQPLTVLTVEEVERMLGEAGDQTFAELLSLWHEADPLMRTYPGLVFRTHAYREGAKNQWVADAAEAWRREMLSRLWPKGPPTA
jgi:hypothetical protein